MKRLDEIESRTNAATEGPWEADGLEGTITSPTDGRVTSPEGPHLVVDGITMWRESDAEFIAHARESVPALVAALRAVLAIHLSAGEEIDDYGYTFEPCKACDSAWPCETVREIHKHLGEDA